MIIAQKYLSVDYRTVALYEIRKKSILCVDLGKIYHNIVLFCLYIFVNGHKI